MNRRTDVVLRRAGQRLAGGETKAAREILREGLEACRGEPRLLLELASLELQAGKTVEVKRLCAQIPAADPSYGQAAALARLAAVAERHDQARRYELAAGKRCAELRAEARNLGKRRAYSAALLLLREAESLRPEGLKTQVDLARLLERMRDNPAALRHWAEVHRRDPGRRDAVERLTRFRPLQRAAPVPEDWRDFALRATSAEVGVMADDLFHLGDERNQFFLAAACADAKAVRSEIAAASGYVDARLHLAQGAFTTALVLAQAALDDVGGSGPEAEPLRPKLARVMAVCLTRLGRHEAAVAALRHAALEPDEQTRLEIDVLWRKDPVGAARLIRDGMCSATSRIPAVLSCCVAAVAGDLASARQTFAAQYVRRLDDHSLPELHLCGAMIALGDGDVRRHKRFLARYFEEFGLEFPLDASADGFDLAAIGFVLADRVIDGPLVSVVMTAYNAEATIGYSVASVLNQTHRNLELLVVDDASTDGTREILAGLAAADNRIRVLRQSTNAGTYAGKNVALAAARGDFLTFHDADDWCHPRRVERHLACMTAHPALVASRSKWVRMTSAGEAVLRWTGVFTQNNPCSLFLRRQVLDEIGYFDRVRVSADAEYLSRVLLHYGLERVAVLRLPLVIGLSHPASLTRSGVGQQDLEGYSPVRERYRTDALAWHRAETPDGHLYMPPDGSSRRFATGFSLVVAPNVEQSLAG